MTNPSNLEKLLSFRIHSIEEYLDLIECIKNDIQVKQYLDEFFEVCICYRGDRGISAVQPHLFSDDLLMYENIDFNKWKNGECGPGGFRCEARANGFCDCVYPYGFECLARMQHNDGKTRLLDFSSDPLVALRFAVGEDKYPPEEKKVTFYATRFEDLSKNRSICEKYMKLVDSDYDSVSAPEEYTYDYFVRCDINDERVRRQKGVFLFAGNFKRLDDSGNYGSSYIKVSHVLSSTYGRGLSVDGYVGTIYIDEKCVDKIRKELESIDEYRMDYLLNIID